MDLSEIIYGSPELQNLKREMAEAMDREWARKMRGWFLSAPPGTFGPHDPSLDTTSDVGDAPA